MIEMVVFDMAGTVVNENNLVYKTVHQALENAGYNLTFENVLALAAGKEKRKAIYDCMASTNGQTPDDHTVDAAFADFKNILKSAYETADMAAFPEAENVFKTLQSKGVKVVLNTGYDRGTVEQILARLNWSDSPLINAVVCASDVENGRPNPDLIELAKAKCNITVSENVAKIGDSDIDIEEGHNANCSYSIGITTGAHTEAQLSVANPTAILNSLDELVPLFERDGVI